MSDDSVSHPYIVPGTPGKTFPVENISTAGKFTGYAKIPPVCRGLCRVGEFFFEGCGEFPGNHLLGHHCGGTELGRLHARR